MTVDPEVRASWEARGWARLPDHVPSVEVDGLCRAVDELNGWADAGGPGLHHFEQTEYGPAIARSEYFADEHEVLGGFVRGERLGSVLADLFGEAAVLFKEKVNYKHPGGGGFAPHQDATAYHFVDHHISVMVPLDEATVASGCLWFAAVRPDGPIPADGRGRVPEAVVETMEWVPVEVEPGDIVFDSYAPHYSETNTTGRPRRALYLTYNAASRGDFRDRYYRDKLAEFDREGATFGDERVRISISDDFLGQAVPRN
jgi:hypothetical protein